MPTNVWETEIAVPVRDLWELHRSVAALETLTPPGRRVRIVGDDHEVREGAIHRLRVKQLGLWFPWHARISDVVPYTREDAACGFTDTAEKSPFASWVHRHDFLPVVGQPGRSRLRDRVEYRMPLGPLGALADALFVAREIEALFAYRHQATARALAAG